MHSKSLFLHFLVEKLVFQIELKIGLESIRLESIRLDLDSSNFFCKGLESKKIIAFSSRDFNSLLEKSINILDSSPIQKKLKSEYFSNLSFRLELKHYEKCWKP